MNAKDERFQARLEELAFEIYDKPFMDLDDWDKETIYCKAEQEYRETLYEESEELKEE